jgi:hypothetical protein
MLLIESFDIDEQDRKTAGRHYRWGVKSCPERQLSGISMLFNHLHAQQLNRSLLLDQTYMYLRPCPFAPQNLQFFSVHSLWDRLARLPKFLPFILSISLTACLRQNILCPHV